MDVARDGQPHDVRHDAAGGEDAPRALGVSRQVAEPSGHLFLHERCGHAREPQVDALVRPRRERLGGDRDRERRGREVAVRARVLRGVEVRRQALVELGQHVRRRRAVLRRCPRACPTARSTPRAAPDRGRERSGAASRGRRASRAPRSRSARRAARAPPVHAPGRERRSARARDANRSVRTRADASSGGHPAVPDAERARLRTTSRTSPTIAITEVTPMAIHAREPSTVAGDRTRPSTAAASAATLSRHGGHERDARVRPHLGPRARRFAAKERARPHERERHHARDEHRRQEVRERRPEPIGVVRLARHHVDEREEPQDRDEHALRDQDRADEPAEPSTPCIWHPVSIHRATSRVRPVGLDEDVMAVTVGAVRGV